MVKNAIYNIILSKRVILVVCIIFIISFILSFVAPIFSNAANGSYTQTVKSGIENFPVEYQAALSEIKESHPNWNFDAYYTGIDWSDLLANETDHGHNRIYYTSDASWKCSCGNVQSRYACASSGIIGYYLDPRNFLNEVNIFQFLEISYNPNIHTIEGVQACVKNTFLDNNVTFNLNGQNRTMSYAQIILDAAKASGMSPYSIKSKIIQEVGAGTKSNGTYINYNGSVSGNVSGYEGIYNFYNYGAYDNASSPIIAGLQTAKSLGWNNQYTAIVEGAKLLADQYTNAGQNTQYFYKWDVVGTSILRSGNTMTVYGSQLFTHQYMTNIQDPTNQSSSIYNTYVRNDLIDNQLNFIIPIYNNMPETVKKPTSLSSKDGELYYANVNDAVNVRALPTTSSDKIGSLTKDTIVVMLQKNVDFANGYSWDKIKLSNGKIGYVAGIYLAPYSITNSNEKGVAKAKVTADILRVRRGTSIDSVLVTRLYQDNIVTILQKNVAVSNGYTWYKIQTSDGNIGYAVADFLQIIDEDTQIGTPVNERGIMTGDNVNIREEPTKYSKSLGKLNSGEQVTINALNCRNADGYTWVKITTDSGITGYIVNIYITEIQNTQDTSKELSIPAITTDNVNLRQEANTTSSILCTIPNGTSVTILQKDVVNAGGYIWYKIRNIDGKEGYVAKDFIKEQDSTNIITSDNIDLAPDFIVSQLKSIIATDNYEVTDRNGNVIDKNSKLGTGYKVMDKNSKVSHMIVIHGDVNGDANITPSDYVRIKNYIMGTSNLDDISKLGADVNKDGKITPSDYVRIKNHIMGTSKISI